MTLDETYTAVAWVSVFGIASEDSVACRARVRTQVPLDEVAELRYGREEDMDPVDVAGDSWIE